MHDSGRVWGERCSCSVTPRRARILLLEQDAKQRTELVKKLRSVDWEILEAGTHKEAFRLWMESGSRIDVLIMNPSKAPEQGLLLWRRLAFLQKGLSFLFLPELDSDRAPDRRRRIDFGELRRSVRSRLAALASHS